MLTQETGERGRKRERKTTFEQDGLRKKRKIDKKMWQKDKQQEIVRDINKSRSL